MINFDTFDSICGKLQSSNKKSALMMFEAMDTKDLGYITLDNFMEINGNQLPHSTVREVFRQLDLDSDGRIYCD